MQATSSASTGTVPVVAAAKPGGDWPRTDRFIPWAVAAFLVMLWLIPFDAMNLPVSLPFDAKLDRALLVPMAILWLAAAAAAGPASPRWRSSAMDGALLLFVSLVGLSVLVNLDGLADREELSVSIKQVALLLSYPALFYVVVTTLRPAEVPKLVTLILALACLTAIGTIWEYRSEQNLFYEWADNLFPGVTVAPDQAGIDTIGRLFTNGPTGHGVAAAALLSVAIPLALVSVMKATERKWKFFYAFALTLTIAGTFATGRKTGALVPAAALLVLLLYRPRAMVRLVPLGLVIVLAVQVLSPGALGSIKAQLRPDRLQNDAPVEGRTEDYAVVTPEIERRPLLGRGYGSYDAEKYRFLDNQYLVLLLETGYLGAGAFLLVLLTIVGVCHRTIRSRDPERAPYALAAAASAVALGVAGAFFDILAFPQVPYMLLFMAAVAVVVRPETVHFPSSASLIRRLAHRHLPHAPSQRIGV